MHTVGLAPCHKLILLGGGLHFDLRSLPNFFRHQPFVQAIHQQIAFLLDQLVLVAGAFHLFRPAPPKSDFAAIDRVLQNLLDGAGCKQRILAVLALDLVDAVILQIFSKARCTYIRINVLVKNRPNSRSFFFVDLQSAIDQPITIGCKTTVPAAFPRFLDASFHRLDTDVFTLDLGHRRQHGDHQLACILGGINAIFHTDQVHAKILHDL